MKKRLLAHHVDHGLVWLLAVIAGLLLSACQRESTSQLPDYGTESDSARFYFLKGWQEILDYGRWTKSERAFRKAVQFDPDWLLGKSLVGRITRNTEERKKLLAELEANQQRANVDELMLLEVNVLSLQASNNRDRGIPNPAEFNVQRRQLAEKNFGVFARKYPEDDYFKAEYIEFLHANHGPKVALDSIEALATKRQKELLFYITYAAALELDLGMVEAAKVRLREIKSRLGWQEYLSPLVLEAQILMAQDSLSEAKALVDQVVQADANHLIARSMQRRLAQQLERK